MSHRLQVLIPESLEARLTKAAERRRISKGEWVRRAIERALDDDGARGKGLVAQLAALEAPTGDLSQMLSEIAAGRFERVKAK